MMSENHCDRDRLTRGAYRYRPYVHRGPPEVSITLGHYMTCRFTLITCTDSTPGLSFRSSTIVRCAITS